MMAATDDTESNCKSAWCFVIGGVIFFIPFIVALVAMAYEDFFETLPPRYSVAIDSFSGLKPSTDLALSPEFNLTLRVTSENPQRSACVEPGMYVEVSYRCVPLAASATATQRLCAGPKKSRDEAVVARGTGVRLPGFMMDGLAADIQSGVEIFDVALRQSGTGGGYDDAWVAFCGGRRVGDAADDLRTRCSASYWCADQDRLRSVEHERH